MLRDPLRTLVRAWLATAVIDGLFASTLATVFYGSTVARLWQGVAFTLLGPAALEGGARTALVGVLMHFGVALAWTALFLALAMRSDALRRAIASTGGALAVAAAYGPLAWMVMSLVVIPTATGRPPTFNARWWVQLAGHVLFVAVPIVLSIARAIEVPAAAVTRPATA